MVEPVEIYRMGEMQNGVTERQPTKDPAPSTADGSRVSIIGTGNFARALAKRLARNGYSVVCGSRYPNRRNLALYDDTLADIRVTSVDTALHHADLVFLALPAPATVNTLTPFTESTAGKVLVDVSNPEKKDLQKTMSSNAEFVARSFPTAHVVKAFNTMSAYAIENDYGSGVRTVYVAGDDEAACSKVRDLTSAIGFTPVQFGRLSKSAELEAMQRELFGSWTVPLILSAVVFTAWLVYDIWRIHIRGGGQWARLPLSTMNKVVGATAITQLALCFLAGGVAGIVQIINGTKHKRFPGWLDRWMKMRKELGVLSLCLAAVHGVMCLAALSPEYFPGWYHVTRVPLMGPNGTMVMVPVKFEQKWEGQSVLSMGVVALCFMSVVGLTSLPEVGSHMTFLQWRFIQSYLGHVTLVVTAAHVVLKIAPKWANKGRHLGHKRPPGMVEPDTTMTFISILLPLFTILLRLVLALPPIGWYIDKIRAGWERNQSKVDVQA